MRLTVLIWLVLFGCSRTDAEAERRELRDQTRLTLEEFCGRCHIPTEPTAQPGALAVFNLADRQWAGRMSNAQLKAALGRIEMSHLPEDPHNALSIPANEVSRFRRYVEVELSRRGP